MCECVYMCWARKILCAGCPGLPTLMFGLPKLLTEKPVGLLPGTRELECTFEQNLAENPVGLPQSVIKKPDELLVSKKFFKHCVCTPKPCAQYKCTTNSTHIKFSLSGLRLFLVLGQPNE